MIGLTWDHPRGYDALAAAALDAARDRRVDIRWSKQPLSGFEEHPIAELCAAHDLVVLDHPHLGEAVRAGCLQPLEAVFGAATVAGLAARTVGQCLASYRYAGQHWALPLDAAAQVVAYRPDLLPEPPADWDAVANAAARVPTVLSLAGPHAALTLFSIAEALAPGLASGGRLFPIGVGEDAFARLRAVFARTVPVARDENPIGILRTMAESDAVALCPLVFGYVNYAVPAPRHRPIAFADAPLGPERRRGSMLGGTGIGVTARCRVTPALVDHLLWLLGEEAQGGFIPAHGGQPSARTAWQDAGVNARWGNFYRDTLATLEAAHVRPRYEGWIAFQKAAAARIRAGLDRDEHPATVVGALEVLYAAGEPYRQER